MYSTHTIGHKLHSLDIHGHTPIVYIVWPAQQLVIAEEVKMPTLPLHPQAALCKSG